MKPPHPPRLLTQERERACPSDPSTFPPGVAINIISLLQDRKYSDPGRAVFPSQNGPFQNFTSGSKVPGSGGGLSSPGRTPPAAPGVTGLLLSSREVSETLVPLKGRLKHARGGRLRGPPTPAPCRANVEQVLGRESEQLLRVRMASSVGEGRDRRGLKVSRCGEPARGFSVGEGRVRRGLKVSRCGEPARGCVVGEGRVRRGLKVSRC